MCGICGIAASDPKETPELSTLKAMARVLRHRGPDQENFYASEGIGLGHERLSVIDLSTGSQPMTNETGKLWIVFNGEIYNFKELKDLLQKKGHPFKTQSDTEVILHLYEEKGADCVRDLRGMFAFAIWDSDQKSLFLARDRVGKKPLFYSFWQERFYFASEIKAILQVPGFPREVDPDAVNSYFAHTYVPYPATAFRHVVELPPAHTLTLRQGKWNTTSYWKPSFENKIQVSVNEASERLEHLLEESVRLRMISDVPLGAFLSGGIDSSAVVATMAKLSSRPIKTFSIGFEEQGFNELPYARMVAERYGTDHEEFVVRPNAMEIIPKIIWHYDQPFSDSSALPTFYVSQMARSKVTVALNGDGGDENFCGYTRYLGLKAWKMLSRIPWPMRKAIASLSLILGRPEHPTHFFSRAHRFLKYLKEPSLENIYLRLMIQYSKEKRGELFSREFQGRLQKGEPEDFILGILRANPLKDPLDRFCLAELLTYLPCDLLVKMDRASMAYGLETRSPLLDHHLIEFAASLPISMKIRGLSLKYLLKRMMRGRLPEAILRRPKWGFSIPISRWFRHELKDYLCSILLDAKTLSRSYWNPAVLKQYVEDHQSGRSEHGFRLWTLLMFELWHRHFIDQCPKDPL